MTPDGRDSLDTARVSNDEATAPTLDHGAENKGAEDLRDGALDILGGVDGGRVVLGLDNGGGELEGIVHDCPAAHGTEKPVSDVPACCLVTLTLRRGRPGAGHGRSQCPIWQRP